MVGFWSEEEFRPVVLSLYSNSAMVTEIAGRVSQLASQQVRTVPVSTCFFTPQSHTTLPHCLTVMDKNYFNSNWILFAPKTWRSGREPLPYRCPCYSTRPSTTTEYLYSGPVSRVEYVQQRDYGISCASRIFSSGKNCTPGQGPQHF